MSFADPARYTGTATTNQTNTVGHGSRTQTETSTPTCGSAGVTDDESHSDVVGVLRLRGAPSGRQVKWVNDTVDNEGLGRKKSKICCIYHKPRAFDESSSSSSSSCSSSEDENAKPSNPPRIPHLPRKPSSDGEGPDGKGKGKAKYQDGVDAKGVPIVRKNTGSARNGTGGHSSESSESDGGLGDGSARPVRQKRRHHLAHDHAHPRTSDCEADHHHHHRHRSHPHHPADDAKDPSSVSNAGKAIHPNAVHGKKSKAKPNKYEV